MADVNEELNFLFHFILITLNTETPSVIGKPRVCESTFSNFVEFYEI